MLLFICTDQEGDLGAGHQAILRPMVVTTDTGLCGPPPPASPDGSPALAPDKLLPPAIRSLGQGPPEHDSADVMFGVYKRRLRSECLLELRLYSMGLFFLPGNLASIFSVDTGNVISLSGQAKRNHMPRFC